ncbi:MAG: hypothetical protein KGJ60_04885 [Verrucomicrobiota bacterium]|nr:hypothetical protein [Verrucomicrobiota bacterium]
MKSSLAGYAAALTLAGALSLQNAGAQNLFVANAADGTISEFDSNGTLINGSFVSGLISREGLAFDSSGNLFVMRLNLGQSEEFDSCGTLITATFATGLSSPTFLAISPTPAPEPSTWAMMVAG